jgi:hypothetical protein
MAGRNGKADDSRAYESVHKRRGHVQTQSGSTGACRIIAYYSIIADTERICEPDLQSALFKYELHTTDVGMRTR